MFVKRLSAFSCHSYIYIYFFEISIDTKIASFWQNCGVKCRRAWAFCPKQLWAFCPRGYIYSFWTRTQILIFTCIYEIDIKCRKTILSNVKPLQIPLSVTNIYIYYLTTWPLNQMKIGVNCTKFSHTWLIVILARYCGFENRYYWHS